MGNSCAPERQDSSEESIGEEMDRRRAVVEPIDLGSRPRIPELACGLLYEWLRNLESKLEENHEILEGRRDGANTRDLGGLFTQVGAVRRRACGGVLSIRIWRGASQAQDVPRCSSAAGSGCVWSCCFVVCLAEVFCRGQSASAGWIVEAHGARFLRGPWPLPGQPRQNLDGAGGACLGGLGIDDRGSTAPRKPP